MKTIILKVFLELQTWKRYFTIWGTFCFGELLDSYFIRIKVLNSLANVGYFG